MTAAVYRSGTPSLSIPQTQNTAPVLEFNCLYTHDIRRKSKRWQDGFLRYHTFNRRVMVYDVPRNFIGDTHWAANEALQDGDEVMLEKDGVVVQVAEAVGRTETDLTELRNSRKKGSSDRGSSPARGPQTPAARSVNAASSRPPTQLKHRSLNALLGTPKGPIGKAALPAKSPFEIRHDDVENKVWEEGRPPKRQRIDHPPAWNVTRTTVASKSAVSTEQPLWARTTDAAEHRKRAPLPPAQRRQPTHEVIDLRDDEPAPEKFLPGFSSDALVPPSSQQHDVSSPRKPAPPVRSSSPGFQTQNAPIKHTTLAKEKPAASVSRAPHRPSTVNPHNDPGTRQRQPAEAPDLAGNGRTESRRAKNTAREPTVSPPPGHHAEPERPTSSKPGSTLRIAASAPKKKMLLCQEQLGAKAKRISSTNTDDAADALLGAAAEEQADERPKAKTQRQLLEERLARINAKQRKANSAQPESVRAEAASANIAVPANINKARQFTTHEPQAAQQTAPEDSALVLTKLDRMLSVPERANIEKEAQHFERAEPQSLMDDEAMPMNDKANPTTAATRRSSPRKKKGVGRREIRASTLSCFQPPALPEQQPIAQPAALPVALPAEIAPQMATVRATGAAQIETGPLNDRTRPFRRSVSETEHVATAKPKRIPGAPMRFTPSPQKRAAVANHSDDIVSGVAKPPPAKFVAPAPLAKAKKPLQRAVSLNTAASGTSAIMPGRPFQASKQAVELNDAVPADVAVQADPWSREAFDLFDWRPPGWDEERWCLKDIAEAVDDIANGAG